jgi:F0F1-type ATP synthase membrane subunit b/b'
MQRSSFDSLSSGYSEMQVQVAAAQINFRAELEKTMQGLQKGVAKAFEDFHSLTEHSSREVNKQISEAWAKTEDAINKQIATLDEQMQNELQRAMNLMGGKLASLSEKFVSHYTPLTERLREVVSLARV